MLEWLSLMALLPFLLQKAAGVGLTITSAHHVVHYTRWWNPAVENQATDRAYRIGQEKEVFVYQIILVFVVSISSSNIGSVFPGGSIVWLPLGKTMLSN